MTFTWSGTSITTDLAKVRHMIGDTVSTDAYLTDEQINYELAQTPDVYLAAANCCRAILAAVARKIDRNAQGFSASRSQLTQHYKDLEQMLRSQASTITSAGPVPCSISDRDAVLDNPDFSPPSFSIGMFSNGSSEDDE